MISKIFYLIAKKWTTLTVILQSVSGYSGLTDSTADTVETNLRTLQFDLLLARSLLWHKNFSREQSKWENPTEVYNPNQSISKTNEGKHWHEVR